MGHKFPSKGDVTKANEADLSFILNWLQQEFVRDGEGFWHNRNIISTAVRDGELFVIRLDGNAVAYQVGEYSADIANVRSDLKRRGLGTALFEASLERAFRDGVNILLGQCMPTDSLPFWERCGFERYDDPNRTGDLLVRRYIERNFKLPEGEVAAIEIAFYPEAAAYDSTVAPLAIHRLRGARLTEGSIQLERRVVSARVEEPMGRDLVVSLAVDGARLCMGKAKHAEAKALGVLEDSASFFIDRLTT